MGGAAARCPLLIILYAIIKAESTFRGLAQKKIMRYNGIMRRDKRGRPPTPASTHHIRLGVSLPPDLVARLNGMVSPRDRSALIARLLRREVEQREEQCLFTGRVVED